MVVQDRNNMVTGYRYTEGRRYSEGHRNEGYIETGQRNMIIQDRSMQRDT